MQLSWAATISRVLRLGLFELIGAWTGRLTASRRHAFAPFTAAFLVRASGLRYSFRRELLELSYTFRGSFVSVPSPRPFTAIFSADVESQNGRGEE